MKISVVMTTYNGEKFLLEQLEAIKNQSLLPNEVLIFDDCSTDSTLNQLVSYISKNRLDWKVIKNDYNLGWQKNFMQGITKATGDLVFLADQDDIWHPDKVKIMSNIMNSNKKINVLVSEFKLVDQEFHFDADYEIDEYFNSKIHSISKIKLKPKTHNISYPGCTFCLRKTFFDLISPAWSEGYPHDALIYLAGWMSKSIYVVESELHYFRRHDTSASLKGPDFNVSSRLARLRRTQYAYIKIYKIFMDNKMISNNDKDILSNYQNWINLRIELLTDKSAKSWLALCTKYIKFYPSFRTLFGDLYTILNSKN